MNCLLMTTSFASTISDMENSQRFLYLFDLYLDNNHTEGIVKVALSCSEHIQI
jgi:hypothetical protein